MKYLYLIFALLLYSCGPSELSQVEVEHFIKTVIPLEKEWVFPDQYGARIFKWENININSIDILVIKDENTIQTTAHISFLQIYKKGTGRNYQNQKNGDIKFQFNKSTDKKWYLTDCWISYDNNSYDHFVENAWRKEILAMYNKKPIK